MKYILAASVLAFASLAPATSNAGSEYFDGSPRGWTGTMTYSDSLGPPKDKTVGTAELALSGLLWDQDLPTSVSYDFSLLSNNTYFSGLNFTLYSDQALPQIYLSESILQISLSIRDGSTDTLLSQSDYNLQRVDFSGNFFTVGFSQYEDPIKDVRLHADIIYTPGYYLAASEDPSCKDISCMRLLRNDMQQIVQLSAVALPEPQTYVLTLAGLAILGFAVRRRSSKMDQ